MKIRALDLKFAYLWNYMLSHSVVSISLQPHGLHLDFHDRLVGKESTCNAGDPGLIPGSGRSAGEGIGYPLQYSQTVLCQTPLSMGFSRQEYWRRLPSPTPGDLPDPAIESANSVSPALAGRIFTTTSPGRPMVQSEMWSKILQKRKHLHSLK